MSFTILIDLDNTLLINDSDRFVQAYLDKIGHFLPEWSPNFVIRMLLNATQQMINKDTPAQTLKQVFDSYFYPGLGVEESDLRNRLSHFYSQIFPQLRELNAPDPEAKKLVEYFFQKNYTVVIATNPVFPQVAIYQRLAWAGLPEERYPFKLVASYETFHFCKPNPAFMAEALGRLGWPDQPTVMIGDNLQEDLIPASSLGFPVFWVNGSSTLPQGLHSSSASGNLSAVIPWLEKLENEAGESSYSTPAAASGVLKSTPAAFEALTSPLTLAQWHERVHEDEWAVNEIACHLRDVDREVNLPRLKMVSKGENPFLPGIVTDVWANERGYINQDGPKAFQSFIEVRSELLSLLSGLDEKGWQSPARHAIFGPTQLLELVSFIATHDRTHIHQVYDTINQGRMSDR
jgi:FMN phosphatase YigB (HAD superfamily)